MKTGEYGSEPRHGLSNRYKLKRRAQKAAEILTQMHLRNGWTYVVTEFDNIPTWVVLKEKAIEEHR
jgi:hypothetical protein